MKRLFLIWLATSIIAITLILFLFITHSPKQYDVIKYTNGKEHRWISIGRIHPFGSGFRFHDKFSDSDVIISGDVEFVKSP